MACAGSCGRLQLQNRIRRCFPNVKENYGPGTAETSTGGMATAAGLVGGSRSAGDREDRVLRPAQVELLSCGTRKPCGIGDKMRRRNARLRFRSMFTSRH